MEPEGSLSQLRKSPNFMEPEGSLLFSLHPLSFPEPKESSPRLSILFLSLRIVLILSSTYAY